MIKQQLDIENDMFESSGSMARKIIIGIVIIFVTSWVGYISVRGLNTNDSLAVVRAKVDILEVKQVDIIEDLNDIKELSRQILDDQIRRQRIGK